VKLSKAEFKKLQKHWYKLLKEHGFNDIEEMQGNQSVIIEPSLYFHIKLSRTDTITFSQKQHYYTLLETNINNEKTVFRNEIHRYILTRHAQGARICTIVNELLQKGTPRERKSVRIIIRRYEMAWKIRTYTSKQLNQKKK
jgi:hypothetical protein